jgi:trk system potassium uptake protein TrkA
VVLIDRGEDRLRFVSESLDVQTLLGSGSSPGLLIQAGIKSADMIVAVTDSDETNLVACLLSRIISPATTRIARIRNPEFFQMEELKQEDILGLNLVINPESEVVNAIVRLMQVPGAVDVVDFADGRVRLIGIENREHVAPGGPVDDRYSAG